MSPAPPASVEADSRRRRAATRKPSLAAGADELVSTWRSARAVAILVLGPLDLSACRTSSFRWISSAVLGTATSTTLSAAAMVAIGYIRINSHIRRPAARRSSRGVPEREGSGRVAGSGENRE